MVKGWIKFKFKFVMSELTLADYTNPTLKIVSDTIRAKINFQQSKSWDDCLDN